MNGKPAPCLTNLIGSWLGLCPDNRIYGRRSIILATCSGAEPPGWGTPKPSPRWPTLEQLGKLRKEFAEGKGPQGRVSGSERVQLARILWHLLKYKVPFDPDVLEEEKMQRKKLARLQTLAAALNYQLTPIP